MRLLLFLPGFIYKLVLLAIDGSRDIQNKRRFKNSYIENGSSFNKATILKFNSSVYANCTFNNVTLGKFSYVGRNSFLQNVNIGNFCSIANNVSIGLGKHPLNFFSTSPLFYKKKNPLKFELVNLDLEFDEYEMTYIKNDVWIGANVIILDGVTIGNGSVIAAGAVVTKDVNDYEIVAGIPAKKIGERNLSSKELERNNLKWWDCNLEDIAKNYDNFTNIQKK